MFLNLTRNVLDTSVIDAAKKVDLAYRRHIASRSSNNNGNSRTITTPPMTANA